VTVPGAVQVGVSSYIAKIPVTECHYTGDNSSTFLLREYKQLVGCVETVRFIVRTQTELW
jgi:hypothetical protein